MGGDQVIDHVAKLPALMEESKGSRVRVSTLNTPECLVLLKKHDFDAMEFVRKIFVNEPLGQYEVAINHFGVADEHSSKSLRQAVAGGIGAFLGILTPFARVRYSIPSPPAGLLIHYTVRQGVCKSIRQSI